MTIKILKGNPTPEELAAALAVVHARTTAAAAAATSGPERPRDSWADPARIAAHRMPQPGATAWSRTYWPG